MKDKLKDIVILGGGISGLSLAYFLKETLHKTNPSIAFRIRVLEKSCRLGGWVHTSQRNNFLFEDGPRGFRPLSSGAEILALVEQLKLQDSVRAVDYAAKTRYILYQGKVTKVPSSITEFLSWPLAKDVLKAGLHEIFKAPSTATDESMYSFISRRLSPEIAERLIDPMASGIFGGDIRYLSIRSCMPILRQMEQSHGSIVRYVVSNSLQSLVSNKRNISNYLLDGTEKSEFIRQHEKSVSVSFQSGMSTLIQALESELDQDKSTDIYRNASVSSLDRIEYGFEIKLDELNDVGKERLQATHVISTLPAYELANIVNLTFPSLSKVLKKIKYVSMGMVHLGYNMSHGTRDPLYNQKGFGYLVPTIEKEHILGCVFDSIAFPSQNNPMSASNIQSQTRLSVMSGGAHFPEIENLPMKELEAIAIDAVSRHLNINMQPDYIHSAVHKNCIPQYHVGFHEDLNLMESKLLPKGFLLGGNSYYGVGLADTVARSRQLALTLCRDIQ